MALDRVDFEDEYLSWYPGWGKALKEAYMQTNQHVHPDSYGPPPRLPLDGSAADMDMKAQLRRRGVGMVCHVFQFAGDCSSIHISGHSLSSLSYG